MKSILFTRTPEKNEEDIAFLKKQTVRTIECSSISLLKPQAITDIEWDDFSTYEWICFTSSFTVKYFWESLKPEQWHKVREKKYMAIGSATARTLLEYSGIEAFVPTKFTANELVKQWLAQYGEEATTILLPKSDIAQSNIQQKLEKSGHTVVSVTLYENKMPAHNKIAIRNKILEGIDIIIVTSPSIWMRFWEVFVTVESPKTPKIYAIGPVTQKAVRSVGMDAKIPAVGHATIEHLLKTIAQDLNNDK